MHVVRIAEIVVEEVLVNVEHISSVPINYPFDLVLLHDHLSLSFSRCIPLYARYLQQNEMYCPGFARA